MLLRNSKSLSYQVIVLRAHWNYILAGVCYVSGNRTVTLLILKNLRGPGLIVGY